MPRYRNQAFQNDAFQNDAFQVGTPVVGGKQPLTNAQRRWLEHQRDLLRGEQQRREDAVFFARVDETRKRFQHDEWETQALRNIVKIKHAKTPDLDSLFRQPKSQGVPYNDDLTDMELPEDSFDRGIGALLKSSSRALRGTVRSKAPSEAIDVVAAIEAVRAFEQRSQRARQAA